MVFLYETQSEKRMDIGQPADFIKAGDLYLEYMAKKTPEILTKGENIVGTAIIDPSAKVSKSAKIGPNVIIGANCNIGEGVKLKNVCLMAGTTIGTSAYVSGAIVGWGSKIGSWCRVEGTTVLGEDVLVKDELHINGAIILPHRAITEHVREPGKVLL